MAYNGAGFRCEVKMLRLIFGIIICFCLITECISSQDNYVALQFDLCLGMITFFMTFFKNCYFRSIYFACFSLWCAFMLHLPLFYAGELALAS